MSLRVAADIGGTFTDLALVTPEGHLHTRKLPSTPANYAEAVIAGMRDLMGELGLPLAEIGELLHGCTVATNAILEHKGAPTALITTRGFRDVLELRRIRTPRLYDPLYVKPPPLVPRRHRFEVTERLDVTGAVVTPLDEEDLGRVIAQIADSGVKAVAVSLLHSYANPAHERRIGERLRAELPHLFVTLSVDLLPQIREYERTSTTVINAYVGPPVHDYLNALIGDLERAGIPGRVLVMQSSGGILDARAAANKPAQIVECGPAAGVIGGVHLGRSAGYPDLITFDMGGTTAKASIVEKGRFLHSDEYEVGSSMSKGSALMQGGGYALKLPAIDISEVGAGGGSIVWLDKAGAIKVGPHSAGAAPGPACYRGGGDEPTVTDANVVLGYLNPAALAGGTVPIDRDRAVAAIAARIAEPLGRGLMETAYGIHAIANVSMMRAIKTVTTYRGRDPRDFTLLAFGGNGGVHAVELARVLRVRRVLVPPAAGVFSALGLLFAEIELNLSQSVLRRCDEIAMAEIEPIFDRLGDRAASELGYERDALEIRRLTDLRYAGQAFELTLPFPLGDGAAPLAELARAFESEHERNYGHRFSGDYPVEIVNLRVIGAVPRREALWMEPDFPAGTGVVARRSVYFGETGEVSADVLGRGALSDTPRRGPLVIEEYEGTTVVPPDWLARLDRHGNIVLEPSE
ncbi:MAG: hydantoinase/oxoprolinase family protein [Alphaproteobacteria bacterium]|nr:hydantoinase/oxoprolinase family protein [Alphaproteobacteria bacterium]